MGIRNPIEWTADALGVINSSQRVSRTGRESIPKSGRPVVRRIDLSDLRAALEGGYDDFKQYRTDVIFLCVFYPVLGLFLARMASGNDFLPLIFPLASGFALLGPIAGIGLYEMSRRREQGLPASWTNAFGVVHNPAFGSILALGAILFAVYLLWQLLAWGIYDITVGTEPILSVGNFVSDVFTTSQGWAMIIVGMAVGFIFACVVLTITSVSFPILLDRNVGVARAVATSIEVIRLNPRAIACWGLIIGVGLLLGSLPLFVGLIFVLPVLGHATWHLYRRIIQPETAL